MRVTSLKRRTLQGNKVVLPSADDIQRQVKVRGSKTLWVVAVLLMLVAAAVGVYVWKRPAESTISYRTGKVEKGDIVTMASATGTLEPTRTVSVGAEISGLIATVEVDANDAVSAGQVLATFDRTTIKSQLDVAQAGLRSATAAVRGAAATLESAHTELGRTKTLAEGGVVSRADLDSVTTTHTRSQAQLDQARANVEQSRANLAEVQLKLQKAVIVSPIDGVVLSRNVEPGQTVASSLQAPELFVVAEDLKRMTLRVWIDEADIGVVKAGQEASFQVSAWQDRKFDAVVEKVSLSPTTTNNVVTYAAELRVDNAEGLLRPGMTATAEVVTGRRDGVLKVPNAALRFRPETEEPSGGGSPLVFTPGRRSRPRAQATGGGRGTVYVLQNGVPTEVQVKTGRSDGRSTEILEGLEEGAEVVVGQAAAKKNGAK